eukprot:253447-Pyramimonas_sp.AAC.1
MLLATVTDSGRAQRPPLEQPLWCRSYATPAFNCESYTYVSDMACHAYVYVARADVSERVSHVGAQYVCAYVV